ncbi:family 10 glycosylhydrolase [uncultured Flavonifractor sp.]|uniref:family 10 glycosylhydrolase n=1 Tax=uncultured Flavonifractor sp. TaxID=1193534 RepID=UPI002636B52A|nr:family 10 glycosylhydrolase [uncultured Flavonifractor sp.]
MLKHWKPVLALILAGALVLIGLGRWSQPDASAASTWEKKDFRGVWVSTVYRLDYPSQATADPAVLKADADEILRTCADLGMTAVILQVRPSADALYPSDYYPWSKYLTGTQGAAPADGFDPLAYWVEQAHSLGLELHAWINPFRITKGGQSEFDSLTADHPAKVHPDWVVEYEGNFYFNPGLPEVRAYIIQGAEELVRNYGIDGIHLDDYFYPGSGFDDAAAYARYGSGFSDIGDWRRDNVNQLVKALGERLHAIGPDLSYGISPSGVWADKSSLPQGSATTGGYESYYASYADSRKWVQEGWIDYICPQVYWYIGHPSMDYAAIVDWWAGVVESTGVSLYIGMADYQAGNTDETSPWYGTAAIEAMLAYNQQLPQVTGEVHFRYQFLVGEAGLEALYRRAYGTEGAVPIPTAVPTTPTPAPTPTSTPAPTPTSTPAPTPTPAPEPAVTLDRERPIPYMEGSGGLFRPEDTLSRAEAVAMLARLAVDGNGNSLYTGEGGESGFSDVSPEAWYAPYVAFAQTWGLVNGYADGAFRPEQPVSRAELVKLLTAFFPAQSGTAAFPDVPEDHWAAQAIAWAAGQGWVSGYPDGTFQPERSVSRAEAARLVNQALGRQAGTGTLPFSDVPVGHWAYGEILAACVPSGLGA